MQRRIALKKLLIASGGIIILPYWMQSCGLSESGTHSSSFSPGEQQLLAKITNAIIPAGNSIGALTTGTDKYLQLYIDDCCEKKVQDNVKNQLKKLDSSSQKKHGKSFVDIEAGEQQKLLLQYAVSTDKNEKDFFELIKTETIRGFNTSKEVMQKYQGYKIAPGHYYGCVNVKA